MFPALRRNAAEWKRKLTPIEGQLLLPSRRMSLQTAGGGTPLISCRGMNINLPGWRWARIMQLALVWSSSSSHSEACKALGGPSGSLTAQFLAAASRVRADATRFCVKMCTLSTSLITTVYREFYVEHRSVHFITNQSFAFY